MRKKLFVLSCAILVALLCFVSCEESNVVPLGTLSVSISDSTARAIEPNISLDVARYELTLLNNDGISLVSKEIDKTNQKFTQNNIPAGSYTVRVDAKNSSGSVIGSGSESCIIKADETTDVSITVSELEGTGTITFTLTGSVNTEATYTLKVFKSDDTPLGPIAFTTVDAAVKAEMELDNGFYYFVVTDSVGNSSAPEAFRIVKGDVIEAEVYLFAHDLGSFRLTITNAIRPNPSLSLQVSDSNILVEEEFTVTAVGMSDSLAYSWYVNGKQVECNGSSINLNMECSGDYVVRCLAKDSESSVVWSCDKTITVHNAGYHPTEITVNGDIETWVIGDVLVPKALKIALYGNNYSLMSVQYGHGHRSFNFSKDTTLSCTISGAEGYSYYFETEQAEDGHTIVYMVIDKEIENPAYLNLVFDYDYVFNRDRQEYRGFYVCPEGKNWDSEGSGFVSLTNNTAARKIKVESGSYVISSYTGSNCTIWSHMSPNKFNVSSGETVDVTVTIPYCRIILKNYESESNYLTLIDENKEVDNVFLDSDERGNSIVIGNAGNVIKSYILWAEGDDYLYRFDANIEMGKTIEVEPVREEVNFVPSETAIPAGRVKVRFTSSVVFENFVSPCYKITDGSGNSVSGSTECMPTREITLASEGTISFADILGTGYTFGVTATPAEDSNGSYTDVVVNVDKEIENYATLRITPNVDASLINGRGTHISLQRDNDYKLFMVPYWAIQDSYDLKIEAGIYRCVGYWSSYYDPDTGKYLVPRVDANFTCTAGETTDVTMYLEERK